MHYLIKANINLNMKLKMSTGSNCFYVTDFISNINSGYLFIINFIRQKIKIWYLATIAIPGYKFYAAHLLAV